MSLNGKVAVVTGSSRSIGRAIAARLAKDGALVCVNYRENAAAADEAVKMIEAAGGEAFAVQGDVTSTAALKTFFTAVDAELTKRRGEAKFDILVNNAGIATMGPAESTSEADFDRVFATNVKGPFFTTQMAIPRLRDGGRIVNISSGLSARPAHQFTAYCMTKSALDTFTVTLAGELGGRQIAVNTIAPGLTDTDMNSEMLKNPEVGKRFSAMTAMGRVGTAAEIADAVALLASPDAGWITGQYVEASGGLALSTLGMETH